MLISSLKKLLLLLDKLADEVTPNEIIESLNRLENENYTEQLTNALDLRQLSEEEKTEAIENYKKFEKIFETITNAAVMAEEIDPYISIILISLLSAMIGGFESVDKLHLLCSDFLESEKFNIANYIGHLTNSSSNLDKDLINELSEKKIFWTNTNLDTLN